MKISLRVGMVMVTALVNAASLAACTLSDAASSKPADGSLGAAPLPAGDGGDARDARDGGGGASVTAAGDGGVARTPANPEKFGRVYVTSFADPTNAAVTRESFSAFFLPHPATVCTTKLVGACQVGTCVVAASDGGPGALPTAGTITVSGGAESESLTPDATGAYPDLLKTPPVNAAGDAVQIAAAGADVPAFAAALVMPAPMTFAPLPKTIDTSSDLEVSWTGGAGSPVTIGLNSTGAAEGGTLISCTFDGSAGRGTLPSAALAELRSSCAGSCGWSAFPIDDKAVSAGDWTVDVTLSNIGASGTFSAR